jgi:hypothetical protein
MTVFAQQIKKNQLHLPIQMNILFTIGEEIAAALLKMIFLN